MSDLDARLAAFVASVRGATDVNPQYQQIEEWAAAGEIATLCRLAALLRVAAASESRRDCCLDETLRHLEATLALTPGAALSDALARLAVGALLTDLASDAVSAVSRRLFCHASMLAGAQDVGALVELFEGHAGDERYDELLMALAQEMTLRGVECMAIPSSVAHWTAMQRLGHPLTWLPVSLMPIETTLPLPTYFARGCRFPLPFGPFEREEQVQWQHSGEDSGQAHNRRRARTPPQDSMRTQLSAAKDTTTPGSAALISSAVQNWKDESHGRFEARTYELAAPIGADQLAPAFFLGLGLDALDGGDAARARVMPATPAKAFGMLFGAAANGGAYNHGHYGAYGRLAAWRSLAGLVGLSPAAALESVLAAVQAATWLTLDAATPWFYQVAWDLALVALAPDGLRLGVLAATDTD